MAEKLKKILVVGGAGYIGLITAIELKSSGFDPIIFDNFINGNRDLVIKSKIPFIEGDILNADQLKDVCSNHKPDAVMHFASLIQVGESVKEPKKYYLNNVVGSLNLISAMVETGCDNLIFSSTAAVYGVLKDVPISESTPTSPINPYGYSKLMVEQLLRDFAAASALRYVVFRYFNASGAVPSGEFGERHDPETHLIPLAIFAANGGSPLHLFGDDYPTEDGTCIRDYVHVLDIASAHILGLKHLLSGGNNEVFNIGTGLGNSVKEVIKSVEKISGKSVPHKISPRREGDSPKLVASSEKLQTQLGWKPRYPKLDDIVSHAWDWHSKDSKK